MKKLTETTTEFAKRLKEHYPHSPSVCNTIDKVAVEMIAEQERDGRQNIRSFLVEYGKGFKQKKVKGRINTITNRKTYRVFTGYHKPH